MKAINKIKEIVPKKEAIITPSKFSLLPQFAFIRKLKLIPITAVTKTKYIHLNILNKKVILTIIDYILPYKLLKQYSIWLETQYARKNIDINNIANSQDTSTKILAIRRGTPGKITAINNDSLIDHFLFFIRNLVNPIILHKRKQERGASYKEDTDQSAPNQFSPIFNNFCFHDVKNIMLLISTSPSSIYGSGSGGNRVGVDNALCAI